ncbi:MAG: DUF1883 domain-containing protein [Phycisphaerae bacterium]|nr:DUF1883 domain-containing protein [Phycisphaerae bacterium]
MDFLHWDGWCSPEDVIEVTLDHGANVQLLDDGAFAAYRAGRSYQYRGGYYRRTPVRLRPPYPGHWHVVVDLGGYTGTVRAAVRLACGVV